MEKEADVVRKQFLLKLGAICAILGAIVSIAAGTGFGNLTNRAGTETVLQTIAAQPNWYWPLVHLGFILGAFLWVGAFTALASTFKNGNKGALAQWGLATVIIGVAVHIIDSAVSGFALTALADAWSTVSPSGQAHLLSAGNILLQILKGTWAMVLVFFHGLPFVLFGLAVALNQKYPTWLGWIGVIGGAGSLVVGVQMFLKANLFPTWLFIIFAVLISLWMIVMGGLMWRHADKANIEQNSNQQENL